MTMGVGLCYRGYPGMKHCFLKEKQLVKCQACRKARESYQWNPGTCCNHAAELGTLPVKVLQNLHGHEPRPRV